MATNKWFLPTNTENAGMMIAQGLICDHTGFKKYYKDILSEYRGVVPVYRGADNQKLISNALDMSISEDNTLTPCLIEINLNNIESGHVSSDQEESIYISDTPQKTLHDNKILFIPAPLPLGCVSKLLFRNAGEKDTFIKNAKNIYGNVVLTSIKTEVLNKKDTKEFFSIEKRKSPDNTSYSLPGDSKLSSLDNEERNRNEFGNINLQKGADNPPDYNKAYSFGGLLFALFYHAKNGDLSNDIYHEVCKLETTSNDVIDDLPFINNYFYSTNEITSARNDLKSLFNAVLDILITKNKNQCKDAIIEVLRSDELKIGNEYKDRAKQLAEKLLAFHRNISKEPVSEILRSAKVSGGKSRLELLLLVLFHRGDLSSFFDLHYDLFDEEDYILVAMLFGIRDKFKGIPKLLREYEGGQVYISNLMAQYAHNSSGTGIVFKTFKSPPTLVDMLKPNRIEFIDWVSKQLGIQDCFETNMPNKDFFNSGGKSTYSGVVLPKIEKINSKYSENMAQIKIDNVLYNKIVQKNKKL